MPPQESTVSCPDCGREFEVQIWTILDLGQEPDLARRFLRGEINVARCPACGKAGFIAAPLAVHDPARERVIFFVPEVPGLDDAVRRAVINQLGNALLAALPPGQRPEYLFRPVVVSDPRALAEALSSLPPTDAGPPSPLPDVGRRNSAAWLRGSAAWTATSRSSRDNSRPWPA